MKSLVFTHLFLLLALCQSFSQDFIGQYELQMGEASVSLQFEDAGRNLLTGQLIDDRSGNFQLQGTIVGDLASGTLMDSHGNTINFEASKQEQKLHFLVIPMVGNQPNRQYAQELIFQKKQPVAIAVANHTTSFTSNAEPTQVAEEAPNKVDSILFEADWTGAFSGYIHGKAAVLTIELLEDTKMKGAIFAEGVRYQMDGKIENGAATGIIYDREAKDQMRFQAILLDTDIEFILLPIDPHEQQTLDLKFQFSRGGGEMNG